MTDQSDWVLVPRVPTEAETVRLREALGDMLALFSADFLLIAGSEPRAAIALARAALPLPEALRNLLDNFGDLKMEDAAMEALADHDAQPPPTEAELDAMARAIWDTEWGGTQPWEHKPNSFKARYRELACAALTALQSMRDK